MTEVLHPALELKRVARSYGDGPGRLDIFVNLDITVRAGEIVALVGPSGAGKSSLLHIAGLLEAPTSGEVLIAGRNCSGMDDISRTRVRRIGIGFIYQFHHLLPEFTALENVVMPQLIAGATKSAARERARALLGKLGLSPRLPHRALANRPLLLLADEPTGNLDPRTAEQVHEEFVRLIREEGLGALIATHNLDLAKRMTRAVRLDQGRLKDGVT
jgi:lipoprotein-releasing system ATP-binding protein